MDNRKEIRPILEIIENSNAQSEGEKFQNVTLRQIIKLQHRLLIVIFKNYAVTRKTDLSNLSEERTKRFIESSLSKDIPFKNQLIGIIVGHFTIEEYTIYQKMASDINKRIINILKKRLKDSLAELK